jgi:hypothetical protein
MEIKIETSEKYMQLTVDGESSDVVDQIDVAVVTANGETFIAVGPDVPGLESFGVYKVQSVTAEHVETVFQDEEGNNLDELADDEDDEEGDDTDDDGDDEDDESSENPGN